MVLIILFLFVSMVVCLGWLVGRYRYRYWYGRDRVSLAEESDLMNIYVA